MLALTLLALAVANTARAQESTVSLFPVGFEEDGLRGEALGTGSEGTTFLLDGTFDTFSIPFTMTLVEDATHISEVAVIETSGISLRLENQCGMSIGQAACTETFIEPSSTSTLTVSGLVSFTGVPILAGSAASALNSTSSPMSQVTITDTTGISLSNPISTLSASISVSSGLSATTFSTRSNTAPVALPSASNSLASASSASRNAIIALGLTFPALFVGLISL